MSPESVDWLAACRRIVESQRQIFAETTGIAERTVYEGIGEGGDRALAIDRRCEDAVFVELERLHEAGGSFTAISEERGEVPFGDSPTRLVIDPIDGSLNARRTIPSYSFSLAVASGPTMAEVEFGYVYDFGAGDEFSATRGGGSRMGEVPLRAEQLFPGLEVVGLESAKPERILPLIEALQGHAYRIRAVGSIAISLCYVAGGRFDAMLTARRCRSVDAAAAQLIAREAGATVRFGELAVEQATLDLQARFHLLASIDPGAISLLLEAQARVPL